MYETIRLEREGGAATIWLSRPSKRNAISLRMMEEFIAVFSLLKDDLAIKTVIIAGDHGVFSAGWDRDEMLDPQPALRQKFFDVAPEFYRALVGFPKPLIGAADRYVLGTAFDLFLLCDARVCSPGARFAHPEVPLGGPCLYTPLKDVVGAGWAREMVLSGRSIDTETAFRIGFVNRISPEGAGAIVAAREMAAEMNAVPYQTLLYTKSYLWTHPRPDEWLPAELYEILRMGMTIQHK